MDYTAEHINNSVMIEDKKKTYCEPCEQKFSSLSSLTTYKKVVDISNKNRIYGLSKNDYKEVQEKIRKQNCFLQYNYIYDKISGTQIPLKDLVISANHNPNRYHALIQNRINTLSNEDANKDLNRMFNNMRSKPSVFKDKVGYVCKKEYTEDKGLHIHAIFIYDGQKVQKDAFKGDEIGKYWEQITQDKGSFHNCNRNKYDKNGIGMLDHRDSEKRKILDEKVITYLCKDEQDIEAVKENKKDRAFTRGVAPRGKGNVGRPRKQ